MIQVGIYCRYLDSEVIGSDLFFATSLISYEAARLFPTLKWDICKLKFIAPKEDE